MRMHERSGCVAAGAITAEKTFLTAAGRLILEYGMITNCKRAARWVEGHQIQLRPHLIPFLGHLGFNANTPRR